ncbi:MAG TPA: peptidyl-tRNA hydrolase [archaeon]|nr:peptidyl-tRNA hydrolase [archaeon]
MKQVILVRTDLDMGKGKLAAQACHASLGAYRKAAKLTPLIARAWERASEAKIVVKIRGEEELIKFRAWADQNKLPSYMVEDAGRTQLEPGTKTALAIGPADIEKLKPTEVLQLL